jgi:hypothetical protein
MAGYQYRVIISSMAAAYIENGKESYPKIEKAAI